MPDEKENLKESVKENVPHLDGPGRTEWLSCLNAAAIIAAVHNHTLPHLEDIDPVRLADKFYAELKVRCPKAIR